MTELESRRIELGQTGQTVSQLALGCMLMGTVTAEATARAMLERYADAGGDFLDTADCYGWFLGQGSQGGESEAVLGRWLHGRQRQRMFVASKGGAMVRSPGAHWTAAGDVDWTGARRDFEGAGAPTLRRALEASLKRLRTDYIDLYYVHVDDRSTPLEETLQALDGMVRSGMVRFVGWSNVRTWRLERIRQLCARHGWAAPVALQQQHSYLRRRQGLEQASIVNDEQLDYLRSHPDLTLVAYSPLLKGIYDDARKRRGHWAMEPYEGPDSEARLERLAGVASRLGASPHQVVLAWLLAQRSPRVVPLVGPRTPDQLEQLLAAASLELPAEACAELDGTPAPG